MGEEVAVEFGFLPIVCGEEARAVGPLAVEPCMRVEFGGVCFYQVVVEVFCRACNKAAFVAGFDWVLWVQDPVAY